MADIFKGSLSGAQTRLEAIFRGWRPIPDIDFPDVDFYVQARPQLLPSDQY